MSRHEEQINMRVENKDYMPEPVAYIGVKPLDDYFFLPLDCEFMSFDTIDHVDEFGDVSDQLNVNFVSVKASCEDCYFQVRTDQHFNAEAFALNVTCVNGGVIVLPPEKLTEGWEDHYVDRLIELVKAFDKIDSVSSIIPYDQFVEVLMSESLGFVKDVISTDSMMNEMYTKVFGPEGMAKVKQRLAVHVNTCMNDDISEFTHDVAASVRMQIEFNVEATKNKVVKLGDKIVANHKTAKWLSEEVGIEDYFYIFISYELTYQFWDMFRHIRESSDDAISDSIKQIVPGQLATSLSSGNYKESEKTLSLFNVPTDSVEAFFKHFEKTRAMLYTIFADRKIDFDAWEHKAKLINSFEQEFSKGLNTAMKVHVSTKASKEKSNIIASTGS